MLCYHYKQAICTIFHTLFGQLADFHQSFFAAGDPAAVFSFRCVNLLYLAYASLLAESYHK